jgi:hypothetical protein
VGRRFALEDTWTGRDAMLYDLAARIGLSEAGERECSSVLPTFATRAVEQVLRFLCRGADLRLLEHTLVLPQPLPLPQGVYHTGSAVGGPAAAPGLKVKIRTHSCTGQLLSINHVVMGPREPVPSARALPGSATPPRAPDATVTLPSCALGSVLYRLSLPDAHLDALAVYGSIVGAAVDLLLGGDVAAVRMCSARFEGSARPGEPLLARLWRVDDGMVLGEAYACTRGVPVITELRVSTTLED